MPPSTPQGRRDELFITSKLWNDEKRPEAVRCVLYCAGPPAHARPMAAAATCLLPALPMLPMPLLPLPHASNTRAHFNWLPCSDPPPHARCCSASAERSIAELGCGRLDLLLIHWPETWLPGTQEADTSVTLQQTWCVGACNARACGLARACAAAASVAPRVATSSHPEP